MTDSPSWLSPEAGGAAAPAASAPAPSPAPATTTTAAPEPISNTSRAAPSLEDDPDLPRVILLMRMANMGAAVALITVSVIELIGIPSIANGVLSVYAILGGLLVCCLETQLKFLRVIIAVNYGFLFDAFWRFAYYVLMASICWAYDKLFGKIVAGCLVGVAVYNTYVLCRYPAYRKVREKIAEEEDKRIEARISKEVKRQAVNQLAK